MKIKNLYILLFLLSFSAIGQVDDEKRGIDERVIVAKDTVFSKEAYDPLAPSRAAFYSAAIPGLGQAYNKKYWKIPIIYAGMGTGVYFYIQNQKDYTRFRDAYKRRLAGFTDDEFYGDGDEPVISLDRLETAQQSAQKNKDYSIITVIAFYALNIIDANVDAHLKQYDISNDLSVGPKFDMNQFTTKPNYTLSLTYKLK
ncbi:hypothetical protein SCB49_14300 [unidentified eubacterium SCB49]|nr:hypothetical protein SCB49_14300 [unidentified eubacterium SCB49]